MNERRLFAKPSAWIPIVLSLAVVAMWIFALGAFDAPNREPDEGAAAHLFQIWLLIEVLLIGFFAIKCLPQAPKQALIILALQIILVIAGCIPVAYFHL